MALDFTGTTADRIDIGSAAAIDDVSVGNLLLWVYPKNIAANSVLWSKNWTGVNTGQRLTQNTSGVPRFFLQRATQNLVGLPSAAGTYAQDKWCFLCIQWDLSTTIKMFHGDITTAVAEFSYTTQQVGTGAQTSDAAGNGIIANDSLTASAWNGYMAYFAIVTSRLLTTDEMDMWRQRPGNLLNMVDYRDFKSTAAADIADRLGNNSATLTGGSVQAHPNLGPYLNGQRPNVLTLNQALRAQWRRKKVLQAIRTGTFFSESLWTGVTPITTSGGSTLGGLATAAQATQTHVATATSTLGGLATSAQGFAGIVTSTGGSTLGGLSTAGGVQQGTAASNAHRHRPSRIRRVTRRR